MKKVLLLLLSIFSLPVLGQESMPGTVVVCPGKEKNEHTKILSRYVKSTDNARISEDPVYKSDIEVSYNGFSEEAQAAFQYAVDIWKQLLPSQVKIKVVANWRALDEGVLGSAGPGNFYRNFKGAPLQDVWYPVALAEKLAQADLNSVHVADINANFNKEAEWYFGTDGKTPEGKTDFVTVVLHEIGHGLGFVDLMGFDEESRFGNWGANTDFFSAYDYFIINDKNEQLVDTSFFANPSLALGSELTGGGLYFNSLIAVSSFGGEQPRLYAPFTWNSGSSIAHLDEFWYQAGDTNSLMSPRVGRAEAIHDPGPLTLSMFTEMGWFYTFINHAALQNTENMKGELRIDASIFSDNSLMEGAEKLHIFFDDGETLREEVLSLVEDTENPGEYRVVVPYEVNRKTQVRYYLKAMDEYEREFRLPVREEEFLTLVIGEDKEAPEILHTPTEEMYADAAGLELVSVIKDSYGIDTSYIEYAVNEEEFQTVGNTRSGEEDQFQGRISLEESSLKGGDSIRYRIVAKDISRAGNVQVAPQSGYFRVQVIEVLIPDTTYVNDFSNIAESKGDFEGSGFEIRMEEGFADGAIHSPHPYQAAGANNERNDYFSLSSPVYVKATNAFIYFDEVVLVEPGEDGAQFGDEGFYDYVIVEGSIDRGESWLPLVKGYDSSQKEEWLNAYHKKMDDNGNSTEIGSPSLFERRVIDLHHTFSPGDVVSIRFRLFSDPAAVGWGWVIDNLSVQPDEAPAPTGMQKISEVSSWKVYPNPAEGVVTLEINSSVPLQKAVLSVVDITGRRCLEKEVFLNGLNGRIELETKGLASGSYLLQINSSRGVLTKRLMVK